MFQKLFTAALIAGASVTSAAGQAVALSEVQFDINSVVVQAFDANGVASAFGGESHTGSVVVGLDSDSFMQAFADGSGLAALSRGGPFGDFGLDAVIEFDNGAVTGGQFTLSIDGGADVYSTSIEAGSGDIREVADILGISYQVDGLTFGGEFSDSLYGDLDVSAFTAIQPFLGNFLHFDYRPDAAGRDSLADIDIFTVIPSPSTAMLAGVAALGLARRRR